MKRLIGKYTEENYCARCEKIFKTEIKLKRKSKEMMIAEIHLEVITDKKCPVCNKKLYHINLSKNE